MDDEKREALEAAGFALGDAEDFLELTPEERAEVDSAIARINREYVTSRIVVAFWSGFMAGGLLTAAFYLWVVP